MDRFLELSESCNNKYPQHFQLFIDNCVKSYAENFGPNDYLFAAVYFIILETGFSPVPFGLNTRGHDSVSFDIRKLKSVTSYTENQIKIPNNCSDKKCCIYRITLKLGRHSSSVCELQGVPSAEMNTHLIINFLLKEPQVVKSLCLNTETYVEKNETPSEHKYLLKNLKELSLKLKNEISVQIKDIILTSEEEGCSANLLCLPEEIQKKIIYILSHDPYSIHSLSSTCTYFYSIVKNDTKLWEEICFREFSGWMLNKALQEICVSGDPNVFRTAFLHLKTKEITDVSRKRQKLKSLQRKWLLRAIQGCGTISFDAVNIIARIPPLDLFFIKRIKIFKHRMSIRDQCDSIDNELAVSFRGGKIIDNQNEQEIDFVKLAQRINEYIHLKWQALWDESNKGRTTYGFFPSVSKRMKNKYFKIDYNMTQVISGHGNFAAYLKRFKIIDYEKWLDCNSDSIDDVQHSLFFCNKWDSIRTAHGIDESFLNILEKSSTERENFSHFVNNLINAKCKH